MIDLNKIINDSLVKIEEEGYVQQVVEKRIKETVKNVIDDCLNNWSSFGKNLKEEVQAKLNINLKELDIAQYNVLVLNAVKEKLDEIVTVQGVEKVKEAMDMMLADVKSEYTLSEIIETMKDREREYKDYSDRATLFIEQSRNDGYVDIYLDDDEKDRKYSCKYQIRLKDGGIPWNIKSDGREFNKNRELGALHGVEELLFKIYATGAKITIDQEDVEDYDLSYHDED